MSALTIIQKEFQSPAISKRIEERLKEKAPAFVSSILDLCSDDKNLAECNPQLIIKEAMKAAALDLPINKSLGFAYIIPYNKNTKLPDGSWNTEKIPQFQMSYKGYIQLAIRSKKYKHLNAGIVYEGEEIIEDRIKGTLRIEGKKTSDKAIGYFCYMKLLSGFEKAVVWTKEKVKNHAENFSKSWDPKTKKFRNGSAWETDFDSMAIKTMVLQLIPKYGPMTIDIADAIASDMVDYKDYKDPVQEEIDMNANSEVIDISIEEEKEESKGERPF